jgi:glycosyltransferase involved in cell wall biosynthesis
LNNIEVSVIIPTYNKFPLNLFTLYSIENQNFDLSKVEVIMIDDGSTDQTKTLENHTFSFHFKLISVKQNLGRPRARNLGIKAATGNIIIFLDAEIIVQPDFLAIHYQYHQRYPNLVVTGVMLMKKVYSVLFPEFSPTQFRDCTNLIKNHSEFQEKIAPFKQLHQVTPLISEKDIVEENYRKLSFTAPYESYYLNTIISNYGYDLKGYRIPWQLFGTGHVSASRKAIDQVGLFAEYPGYGWDDCEMGYRLYKNGATFLTDKYLISYHQEHPISNVIEDQSKKNYYKFQETYKTVDQMIIGLTFLPVPYNLHQINQLLINYQLLCGQYPNNFMLMKQMFHSMLRQIGALLNENMRITALNRQPLKQSEKIALHIEKQKLRNLAIFQPFLQCFERLENL